MTTTQFPVYTERLLLRPIAAEDVDDIYAYHSREDVARYEFWSPRSREEVVEKIAEWSANTQIKEKGSGLVLGVVLKTEDRLIGDIVLFNKDEEARQSEIGFSFNPEYHGKGYATEAAQKIIEIGFETFGQHRIFGRCDARNAPSWKLMERLGMRREAHFREHALFKGGWDEEFYYAILEEEWRQANGADT